MGRSKLGEAPDKRCHLEADAITLPGDGRSKLARTVLLDDRVPFHEGNSIMPILLIYTGVRVVQIFAFNFKSWKIVEISIPQTANAGAGPRSDRLV